MDKIFKQMTPEQYITERVEQYQTWYDKKSVSTKSLYLKMRAFTVVGGGVVPVLLNMPEFSIYGISVIKPLVTIISLLVVIMVSLESVFHYREQWKNYRSTEQMLGQEKYLFRTGVGRYRNLEEQEAFRLFVERVEEAIGAENAATLNVLALATEPHEASKKPKEES